MDLSPRFPKTVKHQHIHLSEIRPKELASYHYHDVVDQQLVQSIYLNKFNNWKLRLAIKKRISDQKLQAMIGLGQKQTTGRDQSQNADTMNFFELESPQVKQVSKQQSNRKMVPLLMLNTLSKRNRQVTNQPQTMSDSQRISWLQGQAVKYQFGSEQKFRLTQQTTQANDLSSKKIATSPSQLVPPSPRQFSITSPQFKVKSKIQVNLQQRRKVRPVQSLTCTSTAVLRRYKTSCDNLDTMKKSLESYLLNPTHRRANLKGDQDDILQKLKLQDVGFQPITDKFPINKALKTLMIEEAIHQKDTEIEEFDSDKFTEGELQRKIWLRQQIEKKTHKEYRRRCLFDYENKKPLIKEIKDAKPYLQVVPIKMANRVYLEQADNLESQWKRRKRILLQIKVYLVRLMDLKLTLHDVVYMNALPTRPFEKEKAAVFLDLVKQNNMSGILDMLYDDRLLVYQFDYHHSTALHIACKRNLLDIAQLLIEYHAEVNAKDIVQLINYMKLGRTPMYFAFREGHSKMVKLLLIHRASPWSVGRNKYEAHMHKLTDTVREAYRKARNFHLQLTTLPISKRDAFWNDKILYFQ